MPCPFCNEEKEGFKHWKECSLDARKRAHRGITTNAASSKLYFTTRNTLLQKSNDFRYGGTWLDIPLLQVLRMWRANELKGHNNYLEQLQTWYPGDDPEEENETRDLHPPMLASTAVLLKQSFETPSGPRTGLDALLVVLAIDNFTQREGSYTTFIGSGNDPLKPFHDREYKFFNNHMGDTRPISIIRREFDEELRKNEPTFELLVTHGILGRQKEQTHNTRHEWDVQEDKILLDLVAEGCPILDCTRRLNAYIANTQGHWAWRAWELEDVRERVEHLLN